jgi:ATP-binding cassette subfamily B protein
MDAVKRFLAIQVEGVGTAVALLSLTVVTMVGIDGPMTLASVPVIPAVFDFSFLFFKRIQKTFTLSA